MMKPFIFFSILTLVAINSFSQSKTKIKHRASRPVNVVKISPAGSSKYSLQQLSGKWQEVSRTARNSNVPVAFSDTMYLFFSGDNVYTKDGVNMSLRGKASLQNGNSLMAAADVFTIRSLSNSEVILDDGDKYIHRLIKKQNFWYETLSKIPVVIEKYETPVPINLKYIAGKWQVYKRDASPGSLPTDDYLVKEINVKEINDGTSGKGEITFYLGGKLETQPCTITITGNKLAIATDKHSWMMNTYKADGSEFIFGDSNLMNYSKPG